VPPKGFVTRFHSRVRPTLPGFSVAPITATVLGEKKTSSGWLPQDCRFLREVLGTGMVLRIRLWSERRLVQGVQHVMEFEAVLADHGLDVAIVAGAVKSEPFENRERFRMTLLLSLIHI